MTHNNPQTYYTVVVFSGSTCMCGSLRHTSNECGHKHRTERAAHNCLNKLQNWSKDRRSCSAAWYPGRVVERETVHDTELYYTPVYDDDFNYLHDNLTSAYDACTC
jgi:hypothetical protein